MLVSHDHSTSHHVKYCNEISKLNYMLDYITMLYTTHTTRKAKKFKFGIHFIQCFRNDCAKFYSDYQLEFWYTNRIWIKCYFTKSLYLKKRNGETGYDLFPVANGVHVSVNQVQGRPVQIGGTPDHDGAAAEGHFLLDCRVNKTFPTTPPDTQPTVVVVQCKAQFVAEEDLSPLLTIPPHGTSAECSAFRSLSGR